MPHPDLPPVTNPTKVIFPGEGITKAELVGHYDAVADRMLPLLAGRPLTLERYPDGIDEQGFIQKNAPESFPSCVDRVEVPRRRGGVTRYPVIHDRAGLRFLADQATVTFHAPAETVADLHHPDRLVFDLDPPPGGSALVRRGAEELRGLLLDLGLPPLLLATGSKGYHLVVLVEPGTLTVAGGAGLARRIARLAVRVRPELFTTALAKAERGGRVFVDHLRNRFPATSVVPYSLRARPGAPVATPLRWEELPDTDPAHYRLRCFPDRLAEPDPWAHAGPCDPRPALATLGADAGP